MDAQKQQAIDRLKTATNILVTVSRDPSVDQLSAAIGITLLLNKLGKHATAVYSGKTPSTIEFLQPEKTIEKNTDSLRDFIIALDKSKADKLRYKVEDQMVKIFITPYRTSISDKDLEFSQGDFNVEVVLALGVARQQDLDQAITSHGRILHDATVIGVGTHAEEEALGSINWVDAASSSLSEMMTHLGLALDDTVLDAQMATALLTGIVAETERFSNQKTSAETMQASAKLMESGANQQLVASELATPEALGASLTDEAPQTPDNAEPQDAVVNSDGSLVIEHAPGEEPPVAQEVPEDEALELPEPEEETEVDEIKIDYDGHIKPAGKEEATPPSNAVSLQGGSRLILQPPAMGGKLTANSEPEGLDPSVDPLSTTNEQPLLRRNVTPSGTLPSESDEPKEDAAPQVDAPSNDESSNDASPTEDKPKTDDQPVESVAPPVPQAPTPPDAPDTSDSGQNTLSDLERFVASPHLTKPEPQEAAPPDGPETPQALEPTQAPEATQATPPSPNTDVTSARDAVEQAMGNSQKSSFEPVKSLNAMPVDLDLGDIPAVNTSPASAFTDPSANVPSPVEPTDGSDPTSTEVNEPDSGLPTTSPNDMHVSSDPGLPPGLITNEPVDMTAAPNANATSSPVVPPPQVPPPMMPPNLGPLNGQGDQSSPAQ